MTEEFVICHNFEVVGYVAQNDEIERYEGMYYSEDQTIQEENEGWTDDITKAKIFKEKTNDFDIEEKIPAYTWCGYRFEHHDSVKWLPIVVDAL